MSKGLTRTKLENYKTILVNRRDELAKNIQIATREFLQEEDAHPDSADQASADVDRTLAMQIKNRESEMLRQIDEALRRIESGAFGLCERCEEPISEARIRAFPLTTLCIDCKTELESEENRFVGRA